ncbi:MAG TPA: hypothetical protein IAA01_07000, partial [Candidatus Fournierella excrementavium]|nr:hypothetical protein [Candidatus Fournierella excrementavium]
QKEEVKSNAKCGWRCSLRTFRCCWNNGPYRAVLQTPRLTWGYDSQNFEILGAADFLYQELVV